MKQVITFLVFFIITTPIIYYLIHDDTQDNANNNTHQDVIYVLDCDSVVVDTLYIKTKL